MMLKTKTALFRPNQFNLASAGVLGTSQDYELDNTWPIEEIVVIANVTAGATGPTLSGPDNILGLIKRAQVSINDGKQPRTIVDMTGPGLLEYASHVGLNLDRGTLEAVRLSQGSSIANNLKFRIAYRIPMVHPCITEPLRTRMLLPVHTYRQPAKLTLSFASPADMYSAGSLSAVTLEVYAIRRQMPDALTQQILNSGGFIDFDLLERQYNIAVGESGEKRFEISPPGSYLNLMFRQYLGGSSVTRSPIDQVTTFGSETKWRLESGGVTEREWTWKALQIMGDYSRVANGVNQTYSPNFAGAIASGTSWQPESSALLDFLTDGLNAADELGSVLDVNVPQQASLKMELVGNVASVATNGSMLYVAGHRLYGSLAKWQAVRAA